MWRGERGHIAGTWSSLSGRNSRTVGLKRIQVDPGMWPTPLHLEGAGEEIFVVLEGDGHLLLSEEGGVEEHEVRTGSIVCRLAGTGVAHSFRGGDAGMTLLVYGTRDPREVCYYPRSGRSTSSASASSRVSASRATTGTARFDRA